MIIRRTHIVLIAVTLGLLGGIAIERSVDAESMELAQNRLPDAPVSPRNHAYYATPKPYDEAYARAEIGGSEGSLAGLVNHHALALDLVAQVMNSLATDDAAPVLLISPNHFNAGSFGAIASARDWETPYGILAADRETINELGASVAVDEDPFEDEHGISLVIPFIRKSLPRSSVIPLIIRDRVSAEEVDALAESLNEELPRNARIIGSFDFSHYLTGTAAEFHDQMALATVESFDYDAIDRLDIDSRPGLRLFLKLLEKRGLQRFSLFANTNSAERIGDRGLAETTSYITGVFSKGKVEPIRRATVLLSGDLMLGRTVGDVLRSHGFSYPFFSAEGRLFTGQDLTVANLEGAFAAPGAKPLVPTKYNFSFDQRLPATLSRTGFSAFSLANNHTYDYGREALDQTVRLLAEDGIASFGSPTNADAVSFTKEIRGMRIGIVGFNEFSDPRSYERVLDEVKQLAPLTDWLAVMPHWGIEYQPVASRRQQELAHAWIDAGANAVIGSHPHVIQNIERYRDAYIFYSLGNFLFDQKFSQETQIGLSVGVVIEPDEAIYYLLPTTDRNFQIALLSGGEGDRLLSTIARTSAAELTPLITAGVIK